MRSITPSGVVRPVTSSYWRITIFTLPLWATGDIPAAASVNIGCFKAESHIPCRSPAKTQPLPCHYLATYSATILPLSYHYSVTTLPLLYHYPTTTLSLPCHYPTTTLPQPFHYPTNSLPLPCHSPTVLFPSWKFLILCMKFSCYLLPPITFHQIVITIFVL
jgi:hypothetical protein